MPGLELPRLLGRDLRVFHVFQRGLQRVVHVVAVLHRELRGADHGVQNVKQALALLLAVGVHLLTNRVHVLPGGIYTRAGPRVVLGDGLFASSCAGNTPPHTADSCKQSQQKAPQRFGMAIRNKGMMMGVATAGPAGEGAG